MLISRPDETRHSRHRAHVGAVPIMLLDGQGALLNCERNLFQNDRERLQMFREDRLEKLDTHGTITDVIITCTHRTLGFVFYVDFLCPMTAMS